MKPAKLQEQIKAAVAKLREASNIEDDDDRAGTLIQEALTELDACATAEIKPGKKVEIREVEKPVAASDSDADKLATQLAETEAKLRETQADRDKERKARKDAEGERDTLRSSILANKILRESGLPEKARENLFEDLVACENEDAMKRLVESKKAERDELVSELRESYIEGAGPRVPSLAPAGGTGSSLLDVMGIDRESVAAA